MQQVFPFPEGKLLNLAIMYGCIRNKIHALWVGGGGGKTVMIIMCAYEHIDLLQ